VVIDVDPGHAVGVLPKLFRPSVMLSWAGGDAIKTFLRLPGRLGTVRVTVEPLLSESQDLEDYKGRLDKEGARLKILKERGATIVLTVARMPRWLASVRDESSAGEGSGFSKREASPPRDYRAFGEMMYHTVRILNGAHKLAPLYEFWNEPNLKSFWRGTQDELFQLYRPFALGARRADPNAQVGGPGVSAWPEPIEGAPPGSEPMLRVFLEQTGRDRTPVDFVSWHNYDADPYVGWDGAAEIRKWASSAGHSPDIRQVVTEWNRWATFESSWYDSVRDDAQGAAYLAAGLDAMSRSGVWGQTYAGLQDGDPPEPGMLFSGDTGLITHQPAVEKASFQVMKMLSALEDRRVKVTIPQGLENLFGVSAVATAQPQRLVVLVYRYPPAPLTVARRHMQDLGYRSLADIGIAPQRLRAYARREIELKPGEASPKLLKHLESARAVAEQAKAFQSRDVKVELRVAGSPTPSRYQIYRVNGQVGNSKAAYMAARNRGVPHEAAVRALQKVDFFAPWKSGSGAPPQLRLEPYEVVLLVLERSKP